MEKPKEIMQAAQTVLETPQARVWWEHHGQRVYSSVMPMQEAEMRLQHLRGFKCLMFEQSGVEPVG